MELLRIRKALETVKAEEIKATKNKIKYIDTSTMDKNWNCYKWNNNTFYTENGLTEREQQKSIKEQKAILLKKELKTIEKNYTKYFEKLAELERVDYIPKQIEIAINWTPSRTWGANPKAELWLHSCGYYMSGSIGGCGYDKRSTAAAEVLGKSKELKAIAFILLNNYKMDFIKKVFSGYVDLREYFGYGLSLGKLYCNFGGGCGMSSILDELKQLGYKTITAHEPNRGSDYYLLELDTKSKAYKQVKKALAGVENGNE